VREERHTLVIDDRGEDGRDDHEGNAASETIDSHAVLAGLVEDPALEPPAPEDDLRGREPGFLRPTRRVRPTGRNELSSAVPGATRVRPSRCWARHGQPRPREPGGPALRARRRRARSSV